MSAQIFKIQSIDGGGIRGVFPAHILCCMTHRLGINIGDQFNMIAGTSTGSIVAAAIALVAVAAVVAYIAVVAVVAVAAVPALVA